MPIQFDILSQKQMRSLSKREQMLIFFNNKLFVSKAAERSLTLSFFRQPLYIDSLLTHVSFILFRWVFQNILDFTSIINTIIFQMLNIFFTRKSKEKNF